MNDLGKDAGKDSDLARACKSLVAQWKRLLDSKDNGGNDSDTASIVSKTAVCLSVCTYVCVCVLGVCVFVCVVCACEGVCASMCVCVYVGVGVGVEEPCGAVEEAA